jgi:hypothetical protein
MSLPPTTDQDAAPPLDSPPPVATGARGLLDNEIFLYCVTAAVIIGLCLQIPDLLNNMIFTFVVVMLGIWIVPQVLKKLLGSRPHPVLDGKNREVP